jgi:hypothetical protein
MVDWGVVNRVDKRMQLTASIIEWLIPANSIDRVPFDGTATVERGDNREDTMGIISWIVIGLIAGFIGSKIVNKTGEGLIRDIILGIIGAFVGGMDFLHDGCGRHYRH